MKPRRNDPENFRNSYTSVMHGQRFAFGSFLLNPGNGTLFRNGELIAAPTITSQMTQKTFTVNGGSKTFISAVEAITGKRAPQ